MDKLKDLIEEAKGINTNDPATQRNFIAVLNQIVVVLEETHNLLDVKQNVESRCSCENLY